MIDCPWLTDSRCGLAEKLTGVNIPCPAGACEECRARHPDTPTLESPGTVVASLVVKADPSKLNEMRPHLLTIAAATPSRSLVQLRVPKKEAAVAEGVGAEVSRILKSIGIPPCQQCAEFAAWMDEIGVSGCQLPDNREKILKRLREKMAEAHWTAKLKEAEKHWTTRLASSAIAAATEVKAAALSVATGLAFKIDWSDPMPGILDEAIRIVQERGIAKNASSPGTISREATPPGN